MPNKYTVIDERSWNRSAHCAVFRSCVEPMFCVTSELDITNFLNMVRTKGYSFTMAMIYAVGRCANSIAEFRYRFINGEIVLYDRIDTSFTYLGRGEELFKMVNVRMADTLENYVYMAARAAKEQKEFFTGPPGNDVFVFSPLPWVSYTHISHTNQGRHDNAVPMFDWGKYFERDGKIILPFSVQAHHSFVDGVHIGMLAESLQRYLNK